jgi:hypothetical protein
MHEYKVLNKTLMLERHHTNEPWRVVPNVFEAVKAYCIADAKNAFKDYLPCFVVDGREIENLERWRLALTKDNPPEKVNFRLNPERFIELVTPLDFSKPFNQEVVDKIRAEFVVNKATASAVIDAEDIELDEEV